MELDVNKLRIDNIIYKYSNLLFENPNIVGFGRGLKRINGRLTKSPSLTIYVEKKLSPSALNKSDIIPKYFYGVITDVIEVGESITLRRPTSADVKDTIGRYARGPVSVGPVSGGMSIGNANNKFYGTITCALSEIERKDNKGNIIQKQENIYLLSCNRILTRYDTEPKGTAKDGDVIRSEKKGDIGILRKIAPIYISKDIAADKDSPIDAAVAYVAPNTLQNQQILAKAGLLDGTQITAVTTTNPGVKVYFIGAKGGKQSGVVDSVKGPHRIKSRDSQNNALYEVQYTNVTTIKGKYNFGDEGAIGIFNTISSGPQAFGMLVGGVPGKNGEMDTLYFTDLGTALSYFKLELLKPIQV